MHRDGKTIIFLEVGAAFGVPIRFERIAYVRIGDATPPMEEHPDREKRLLAALVGGTFETEIAIDNVQADEVFELLGVTEALELVSRLPPKDDPAIQLEQLRGMRLIERTGGDHWSITNRAAILFARNLADFGIEYERRAPRIIFYKGDDRISTEREQTGSRGYALGLTGLFEWLESRLPRSEQLRGVLREDRPLYPPDALRELIANALIHQDFSSAGTGPMIEVFGERLEISNPGVPLVAVDRMLDEQPRSRNEKLAFLMRQMGFAEERGSGIDKVIFGAELFQLPAPAFEVRTDGFTATMFAPRDYGDMTPDERIRACYQHASLLWASGRRLMTNSTLRVRFGLGDHRASQISRLIADALEAGAIKLADPENRSRAQAAYQPYWA
jgi:predicted HTH transcriptional regulator